MRKLKYLVTSFGLILCSALTACNGGYIKCKSIQVGNTVAFDYSPAVYQHFAKYEVAEKIVGLQVYEESNKMYIYVYASFDEENIKPKFPAKATIQDYYEEGKTYEMSFVYEIGKYTSYADIFYSKAKKTVKYESYYYKPIKAQYDTELQEKAASRAQGISSDGDIYFSSARMMGEYIRTSSETKIVDTGNEVVTYSPLSK